MEATGRLVRRLPGALRAGSATLDSGAGGEEVGVLSVHNGRGQECDQGRERGQATEGAEGGRSGSEVGGRGDEDAVRALQVCELYVLRPEIIVDSRTAVRMREQQKVAVLMLEYPEVDWGNIMDERLLISNGLRLQ